MRGITSAGRLPPVFIETSSPSSASDYNHSLQSPSKLSYQEGMNGK